MSARNTKRLPPDAPVLPALSAAVVSAVGAVVLAACQALVGTPSPSADSTPAGQTVLKSDPSAELAAKPPAPGTLGGSCTRPTECPRGTLCAIAPDSPVRWFSGSGNGSGNGVPKPIMTCQDSGLPNCAPKFEKCNGKDDDCDGKVDNFANCSDGSVCNGSETCKMGTCQGGVPLICDDGNACSVDSCDPKKGCKYKTVADGATCDDGSACTGCTLPTDILYVYDLSAAKNCTEQSVVGCNAMWMPGFFDGNEKHPVRFDLMNGAKMVWMVDGTAKITGTVVVYNLGGGPGVIGQKWDLTLNLQYRGQGPGGEGSGGPKLDDGWVVPKKLSDTWHYFDVIDGQMLQVAGAAKVALTQYPKNSVFPLQMGFGANGKTWEVSSSAWLTWTKVDGKKVLHGHGDFNCDMVRNNVSDCDKCVGGKCTPGKVKECNDGSVCTLDACVDGKCAHGQDPAANCDDSNVCTADSCDPVKGCVNSAVDGGQVCDDGQFCSVGDICKDKKCVSTGVMVCDDNDVCTTETCKNGAGCQTTATTNCDDSDACTEDVCDKTKGCVHVGLVVICDDGDPCTWDACDKTTGACKSTPLPAGGCDDGNVCTTGEKCQNGACVGAVPVKCDDGNACTVESCNKAKGCVATPTTGVACDDGNACTGACSPPDGTKKWTATKAGVGAGAHALTMPGFCAGAQVRMAFDPGAQFSIVNGKGHLLGSATTFLGGGGCTVGEKWLVDIWFNYRGQGAAGEGLGGPKLELPAGQITKAMTDTWLYFDISAGQAKVTRAADPNDWAVLVPGQAGAYFPFQVGVGANGKNLNFGASAWFDYTHTMQVGVFSGLGDINIDLNWLPTPSNCDKCAAGVCQGPVLSCDDHNPFTLDSCLPKSGCQHVAN